MSVFDLPRAHMPPSHESHPSNAMWEFLNVFWTGADSKPIPDPSYRVEVFGQSCIVVSEDGETHVVF